MSWKWGPSKVMRCQSSIVQWSLTQVRWVNRCRDVSNGTIFVDKRLRNCMECFVLSTASQLMIWVEPKLNWDLIWCHVPLGFRLVGYHPFQLPEVPFMNHQFSRAANVCTGFTYSHYTLATVARVKPKVVSSSEIWLPHISCPDN